MGIDRAAVRHIARLAALELPRVQDEHGAWVDPPERLYDDAALDKLSGELARILEHVEQIRAIDLTGVEPTSHGVPLPPLLRADETAEPLETNRALSGAPDRQGDAFAVPKVIE